MTPSDRLALFLPVVRTVFLPREFPLGAFQPLAFVGEVWRLDGGSISIVCVLQDSNVNSDNSLWILRFLGSIYVHVDAERGESFSCGFPFDRDLFDGRVFGG
jgi:hypothetical protein